MARQTNIYKLDRRDIQEQLALSIVLDKEHQMVTIQHFCGMFSIPLDQDVVDKRVASLNQLKELIIANAASKTVVKSKK